MLMYLLLFVQQCGCSELSPSQAVDDEELKIEIKYTLTQNIINIDMHLLNDSFTDDFDSHSIHVEMNTSSDIQQRKISDYPKNVFNIKIEQTEASQNVNMTVSVNKSDLKTVLNRKLVQDYSYSLELGTQLPQLYKLDVRLSINWMQNSTIMDIVRLFPLLLLFFTHIQGILVILLADIFLPQRFYELLRLYSCFVFNNVQSWPLSQEYPQSQSQNNIFGEQIDVSDGYLHISRIGIHENIFVQVFYYLIVLLILWLLLLIFRIKNMSNAKQITINVITSYHKTTLLLLLIVSFNQIRMAAHLNSTTSILSLIFSLAFLAYIAVAILILFKKVFRQTPEGEQRLLERNAYQDIRNSMRLYFLSYSSQLSESINDKSKLQSTFIKFFPLCGLLFKVYTAFILVFMQSTNAAQITILIISYLLYSFFTYRFFLANSRINKILKLISQISFIWLLTFSIVNHIILKSLVNTLPSKTGVIISEEKMNSINGIEIMQIVFLSIYFIVEFLIKMIQFQNLIAQAKDIQFYESSNRQIIQKKQIEQISNAYFEMLNQSKQSISNNNLNRNNNRKQVDTSMHDTKKEGIEFGSSFQNTLKNSIVLAFKNQQQGNTQIPQNFQIENSDQNDTISKKNQSFSFQNLCTIRDTFKQSQVLKQSQILKRDNEFDKKRSPLFSEEEELPNNFQGSENNKICEFIQQHSIKNQEMAPQNAINDQNEIISQSLKLPLNLKPILKPTKYSDPLQQQIQFEQNQNQNQMLMKGNSAFSCDQSDIDAFSSIQKVLSVTSNSEYKNEDQNKNEDQKKNEEQNKNEEFKNNQEQKKNEEMKKNKEYNKDDFPKLSDEYIKELMKKNNILILVKPYFLNGVFDIIDPQKKNQELRNVKQLYSLLISQEIIQKTQNIYDQNSDEFINSISFLKEAIVRPHRNEYKGLQKKIDPIYNKKNFSITNHNYDRYMELKDCFEKKKRGNKLQINTRIFFDVDAYPYNSQININSHLSYTFSYSVQS